ncbi:MAG: hypothetical protein LBT59_18440, partial [Clostridiales bacterium]|nr:hypothetical protein [Clostridiales bacterium]
MKALKKSIAIALALCLCIGSFTIRAIASEDMPNIHVYAPSGDDPSTPDNESPDVESSKYQVKVNGVAVPAIKYNQNGTNMDIARFASDSKTPEYEVSLINGETISSIQVYPSHYYPAESMAISADKKSVKFSMSEKLSYAIVYINGTPSDQNGKPYLALINDPLEAESEKPVKTASNVLDFKAFSTQYLLEHPINDVVGEVCLVGGTVQDYSNNDSKLYTLSYPEGVFVDYDSNQVTFPNKRARKANDVSDALQAALQKIKEDPALDTLYIPSGCYLWSGLRIEDWNGDVSNGGKPLIIYTEEGALLENRLSECKEAMEPAIWIKNSSFVTISGRGMHDGKGLINTDKDKKDARNTPHQGGSMLLSSQNIVFNDTYVRDVKQWNWECHTVENIEYNNIKGLSPYNHAWVDGLDLTSGKNVTVNGAITLGNDDCFASGHYNPSNEFPARSIKEDKFTETIGAAAYYYNRDRMSWDTADSENIVVKNSLHWTLGAGNGLRTGHNAFGYALKSYHFENFNVMNFTAGGWGITIQANSPYSKYEEFTFKDCYFNTDRVNGNIKINGNASDTIESVEMDNVVFTKSA